MTGCSLTGLSPQAPSPSLAPKNEGIQMINGAERRVKTSAEVIQPTEFKGKWAIKMISHPVIQIVI